MYLKGIRRKLKNLKCNNIYINLGIDYSLYFTTYILSVIETALRNQVDKVYYFTREGEFFKQIHDAIEKENIFGFPIPKAEILEVSRMATYAPSINNISVDGMMRLWNQYPNQSLKAFLKSLNLTIDEYKSFYIKYGIENIDMPLIKIYNDEAIINLFNDKDFITKLKIDIEKKRNLFLKYLKQKGIDEKKDKIFVVDVGWRGSIQDNIALLLPQTEVVGYYMGLFRSYNKKVTNSRKIGFVYSNKKENHLWYLRHPYPIEMYTNSKNGSVVGYTEMEDGSVKAVRNNYSDEDIIFDKYIEKFQKGVLLTVPTYGQTIRTFSFLNEELKPYAINNLKKFIVKPNKKLTKPFFELVYNDTFGNGHLEHMSLENNIKTILKYLISPKELIEYVENSHWPHGFLMRYNLTIINWLYSKLAKDMYVHYSCIQPIKYSKQVNIQLKDYKEMHIKPFYKRETYESNSVCIYIRSRISIPRELDSDYEIFIKPIDKNVKALFTTEKIIQFEHNIKNIYFETKIPKSKKSNESYEEFQVIVLNRKNSTYCMFNI